MIIIEDIIWLCALGIYAYMHISYIIPMVCLLANLSVTGGNYRWIVSGKLVIQVGDHPGKFGDHPGKFQNLVAGGCHLLGCASQYVRAGWWFKPSWKTWKSMGRIIPYIMEKCLKPPTKGAYTCDIGNINGLCTTQQLECSSKCMNYGATTGTITGAMSESCDSQPQSVRTYSAIFSWPVLQIWKRGSMCSNEGFAPPNFNVFVFGKPTTKTRHLGEGRANVGVP